MRIIDHFFFKGVFLKIDDSFIPKYGQREIPSERTEGDELRSLSNAHFVVLRPTPQRDPEIPPWKILYCFSFCKPFRKYKYILFVFMSCLLCNFTHWVYFKSLLNRVRFVGLLEIVGRVGPPTPWTNPQDPRDDFVLYFHSTSVLISFSNSIFFRK